MSKVKGNVRFSASVIDSINGMQSLPKLFSTGARSFLGFHPQRVAAMRSWLPTAVYNTEPAVATYRNAHFVPLHRLAKGVYEGGVFDSRGYIQDLALGRGTDQQVMLQPRVAQAKPVFKLCEAWYGGVLFDHYGHFLVESLSRVADRRIVESSLPIAFFNPQRIVSLRPYMLGVFEHIGISRERVMLVDRPTAFECLYAMPPAVVARGSVNVDAKQHLQRDVQVSPSAPIYLSRSRLNRPRTVRGEEPIEEELARRGVHVLFPEAMETERQLSAIAGAPAVVGVEGAALHTPILVSGDRTLVMLCSGMPTRTYLLLDELMDGDTIYINALADGNRVNWGIRKDAASLILDCLQSAGCGWLG